MPTFPISLQRLSLFILLFLICAISWILVAYKKVPFQEYSIKSDEIFISHKTEKQMTKFQTNQEKERNVSLLRETVNKHKPLPFLKITKYTPKEITDIMGLEPIKFDKRYKNPCFKGDKANSLFKDGRLHCLPYFYILGVKKSGTTDLHARLRAHKEFQKPKYKECQWFPRIRNGGSRKTEHFGVDNRNVRFYISLFNQAAAKIKNCQVIKTKNGKINPCITADATPGNLHMHTRWDVLPGNEGLTEPRFTNFHYIKHLTPDVKIIVIYRDPVTRLFSDFLHEKRDKSRYSNQHLQQMFDSETREIVLTYKDCFSNYSMRRCIFNETLLRHIPKERRVVGRSFSAGFYAFYTRELFSVFRKDQILTINMNRYTTIMEQVLKETFEFLGMSPLKLSEMQRIVHIKPAHQASRDVKMWEKTENMLYNFFKPYNEDMASLLQDNSYLFLKP